MKNALFITSFLLCISWVLGITIFKAGITIHVLLLSAVILFLHGIILTPKTDATR